MAIPKLLDKMRHSVQDTGDTMTGSLTIENSSMAGLSIRNDSDSSFSISRTGGVEATTVFSDGGFWLGSDTNLITFISDAGVISGLADPTEADQAATKNYVDNSGGTFYAIYGTTTYQEIVDAFNAGKTCKALYSSESSYAYIFDLVTRPTSSNPTLYFVSNRGDHSNNVTSGYTYLQINASSTWNVQSGTQGYVTTPMYRSNFQTPLSSSTAYYRPIIVSTAAPTASEGYIGDIWIQYSM